MERARFSKHLSLIERRSLPYDGRGSQITNIHGLPVSAKTTARRCREVDLISRYARSKSLLMAKHKKDRLEWALRYVDWTVEDWLKVVWSDECIMKIRLNPQRQRVLHVNGTALHESNLAASFKSKCISIMIWVCFSGNRLDPVIHLNKAASIPTSTWISSMKDWSP